MGQNKNGITRGKARFPYLGQLQSQTLSYNLSQTILPNKSHPGTSLGMKRKPSDSPEPSPRKAAKIDDYCSVEQKKDAHGIYIWPAPEDQMRVARKFLKEW
jgi:hypothetical protein